LLLFVFLIQGLTIQLQLAWSLLFSPGWLRTHDPPASDSQVLEVCTTMSDLEGRVLETRVCILYHCLCQLPQLSSTHCIIIPRWTLACWQSWKTISGLPWLLIRIPWSLSAFRTGLEWQTAHIYK
jgi:hypothetical protein